MTSATGTVPSQVTARTDLIIEQGTTWQYGWHVQVGGSDLLGSWTGRSQVRRTFSKLDEVLHNFTVLVSGSIVIISVTPEESTDWAWTNGVYDVEIVSESGAVYRVAQGSVSVSPEVTR